MRPTPVQLLRGARQNIDTVIIPDLRSEWAVRTASTLASLLDYLMIWYERGPAFLQEDNARLSGMVDKIEQALRRLPSPKSEEAILRMQAILAASSSAEDDLCAEALMAENERLRAAVEAALPLLEELPAGDKSSGVVAEVQRTLREQVQQEFDLIKPLMVLLRGQESG